MTRSVLLLALLTAACASHQPPTLTASPSHPALGINDGFHSPLPPDLAAHYAAYRVGPVIRTPQLSRDGLTAFLRSVEGLPIRTLALIEAPDPLLARDLASVAGLAAIENGNELELPPHDLTPLQYANAQRDMMSAERDAGFTGDIVMGVVYALTSDTKEAITLALSVCGTCLVGVHLYTMSADDVAWLNGLDADIAITETGAPTNCQPAKLLEQATYLRQVYAWAQQIHRLKYFIVYQRASGPTCSDLDTFGIQNFDGTWKPAEEFFR